MDGILERYAKVMGNQDVGELDKEVHYCERVSCGTSVSGPVSSESPVFIVVTI
jgi:hypothetical protein